MLGGKNLPDKSFKFADMDPLDPSIHRKNISMYVRTWLSSKFWNADELADYLQTDPLPFYFMLYYYG